MSIYRGLLKKSLTDLELCDGGQDVPLVVLSVKEPKEVCPENTCCVFQEKVKGILRKGGIVLLEMPIDTQENIDFLKCMTGYAVWLGITGHDPLKLEAAFEAIREKSDVKIVIRPDDYAALFTHRREWRNVIIALSFDVAASIEHHMQKLQEIEREAKVPTITYLLAPKKGPTGGCTACQAPNYEEMKELIKGLKTTEEEKKSLLRALHAMPVPGKEHFEAMYEAMEVLNRAGRGWILEGITTFCTRV